MSEKDVAMHVCLFEDRAQRLEPLCLTRLVFELRCGITTLAQKQWRHFFSLHQPRGVLVRSALAELYQGMHPTVRVNDADWLREDDLLLINGRWLPPRAPFALPTSSCAGVIGSEMAFVFLRKSDVPATALTLDTLPEISEHWQHTLPVRDAGGCLIDYPWDLVEHNAAEIERDYALLAPSGKSLHHPPLTVIGPHDRLWVAPSARIEPLVVVDTTHGPVVVDEEASIAAFTRLEGPCYIGAESQILGAKIRAGTTIGPQCRIGGEVEGSIVHGFSNKYHEGFLGHSYVGEWVNFGAGTHNSDLRNDYGEITIMLAGQEVPTSLNKAGCFLGDHTKTGLGTLINTGTNVGAFCNLLPVGQFAPRYMPSFTTWWKGALREAFTLDEVLTTASTVMQRRGVTLTEAHKTLYTRLIEDTAQERRRLVGEQRHLRRSA